MLDIFYTNRAAFLADLRLVRADNRAAYPLARVLRDFVTLPDGGMMAREYL